MTPSDQVSNFHRLAVLLVCLHRRGASTNVIPPDGTIPLPRVPDLPTISCRLAFQALVGNRGVVLGQRML
jgi:hypothetical protein